MESAKQPKQFTYEVRVEQNTYQVNGSLEKDTMTLTVSMVATTLQWRFVCSLSEVKSVSPYFIFEDAGEMFSYFEQLFRENKCTFADAERVLEMRFSVIRVTGQPAPVVVRLAEVSMQAQNVIVHHSQQIEQISRKVQDLQMGRVAAIERLQNDISDAQTEVELLLEKSVQDAAIAEDLHARVAKLTTLKTRCEEVDRLRSALDEQYFGELYKSKILSIDDMRVIDAWVRTTSRFRTTVAYVLLYRGSEHAFSAAKFHESVGSEDFTLHVVQTPPQDGESKFGGFTTLAWPTDDGAFAQNDPDAFVFNLRTAKRFTAVRQTHIVQCNKAALSVFGSGPDFAVCDRADANANSQSLLGHSYACEEQMERLAARDRFAVKEIEVYKVLMDI